MRNVCSTVDEFLENLNIELMEYNLKRNQYTPPGGVEFPIHRKSVFLSKHEVPIDENKRNAIKFDVVVVVSAVVSTEEGEYLLECSENQGIDYHDASNERKGTENANKTIARVNEFCNTNGLMVRPGAITY